MIITSRPEFFQEYDVIENWVTILSDIETRLSDFHKMSLTVMKVFYNKQKLKVIQYRKYNDFFKEVFMNELESTLSILSNFSQIPCGVFKSTDDKILQKQICPGNSSFIRK